MSAELVAEARATAKRFNDAGLRYGIESLLNRLADELDGASS